MSSISQRIQDMPPPGGFKSLDYYRVPMKSAFRAPGLFAGYVIGTFVGFCVLKYTHQELDATEIENRSSRMAIHPLLLAERDREYLKQCRRNRDEEARLMKNVDGWEVGTWYGERIYNTVPKDQMIDPHSAEYYVHARNKDYEARAFMNFRA